MSLKENHEVWLSFLPGRLFAFAAGVLPLCLGQLKLLQMKSAHTLFTRKTIFLLPLLNSPKCRRATRILFLFSLIFVSSPMSFSSPSWILHPPPFFSYSSPSCQLFSSPASSSPSFIFIFPSPPLTSYGAGHILFFLFWFTNAAWRGRQLGLRAETEILASDWSKKWNFFLSQNHAMEPLWGLWLGWYVNRTVHRFWDGYRWIRA